MWSWGDGASQEVLREGMHVQVLHAEGGKEMKHIYQYNDVGDCTRWIAADTEAQADAYAQLHAWAPCGGVIFNDSEFPNDEAALRNLGCDAVV